MPKFDHFHFIAPHYEKFIRYNGKKPYKDLLRLPVKGKLLDVGGGTGRISINLAGDTGIIIVVDSAMGMLREAKKKQPLEPISSEAEKLPFGNHTFERIMMVDALHHVWDQRETIEELWRILIPGGILLIEEPDIHSPVVKLIALMEKILLMRSHFLSGETIRHRLQQFTNNINIVYEDHNVYITAMKDKS